MSKLVGGVMLTVWVFAFVGDVWALQNALGIKRQFFTEPIPKRLCAWPDTDREFQPESLDSFFQAKVNILYPPASGHMPETSGAFDRLINKVIVKVEEVVQGDPPTYRFYLHYFTQDSGSGVGGIPKNPEGKSFYILGHRFRGIWIVQSVAIGALFATRDGECFENDGERTMSIDMVDCESLPS